MQSLPASTYQDVKDILSGIYEKVEDQSEYEVKRYTTQESIDDLTRLIREAKNGNQA